MNKLFVLSTFLLTLNSALACPDISGLYGTAEYPKNKAIFKFEQTECQKLKRSFGILSDDKKTKFLFTQDFLLDGTELCNSHGACEGATATTDTIVLAINFNGSVASPEHGKCAHNGYSLSPDGQGNLKAIFEVKDCKDGYEGPVEKVFPKL